jgi:hypothetical protein
MHKCLGCNLPMKVYRMATLDERNYLFQDTPKDLSEEPYTLDPHIIKLAVSILLKVMQYEDVVEADRRADLQFDSIYCALEEDREGEEPQEGA